MHPYRSEDGILSSSDPEVVRRWDERAREHENDKGTWTEILRGIGVKLAHPDDGWVNRKANVFQLSWYPQFDDKPEVGDLIAFGCPPGDAGHYRSWRDIYAGRQKDKDPWVASRARHYADSPEVAAEGYRICRVTAVDRLRLSLIEVLNYEDTGLRLPEPPAKKKTLLSRLRRR